MSELYFIDTSFTKIKKDNSKKSIKTKWSSFYDKVKKQNIHYQLFNYDDDTGDTKSVLIVYPELIEDKIQNKSYHPALSEIITRSYMSALISKNKNKITGREHLLSTRSRTNDMESIYFPCEGETETGKLSKYNANDDSNRVGVFIMHGKQSKINKFLQKEEFKEAKQSTLYGELMSNIAPTSYYTNRIDTETYNYMLSLVNPDDKETLYVIDNISLNNDLERFKKHPIKIYSYNKEELHNVVQAIIKYADDKKIPISAYDIENIISSMFLRYGKPMNKRISLYSVKVGQVELDFHATCTTLMFDPSNSEDFAHKLVDKVCNTELVSDVGFIRECVYDIAPSAREANTNRNKGVLHMLYETQGFNFKTDHVADPEKSKSTLNEYLDTLCDKQKIHMEDNALNQILSNNTSDVHNNDTMNKIAPARTSQLSLFMNTSGESSTPGINYQTLSKP